MGKCRDDSKYVHTEGSGKANRFKNNKSQFLDNKLNFRSVYVKKGKEFNPISITHLNAQSLRRKLPEFRDFVCGGAYDVICVSETWFDDSTEDSFYLPDG